MNLESIITEIASNVTDNYISAVYVVVLLPIMWHAGFALGLIRRGR